MHFLYNLRSIEFVKVAVTSGVYSTSGDTVFYVLGKGGTLPESEEPKAN